VWHLQQDDFIWYTDDLVSSAVAAAADDDNEMNAE
jgi:hypothetical protein